MDYSLVSKKILISKMACWIGTWGQVYLAKKQKHAPIMMSPTENLKSKMKKIFFNLN